MPMRRQNGYILTINICVMILVRQLMKHRTEVKGSERTDEVIET